MTAKGLIFQNSFRVGLLDRAAVCCLRQIRAFRYFWPKTAKDGRGSVDKNSFIWDSTQLIARLSACSEMGKHRQPRLGTLYDQR
jgi:hypothetical protein